MPNLLPPAPSLVLIGIFFIAMALVGRGLRPSPNGGMTVTTRGRVRLWQLVAAILVLLLGLNYLEGLDRPDRGRQRRIPVFVVDAERMPHIAAHILFAWKMSPPKPSPAAPGVRPTGQREPTAGLCRLPSAGTARRSRVRRVPVRDHS